MYVKIICVGKSNSYDINHFAIFIIQTSGSCFICNKALYTSHIVTGGMVKVEFDICICIIVLISLHHLV